MEQFFFEFMSYQEKSNFLNYNYIGFNYQYIKIVSLSCIVYELFWHEVCLHINNDYLVMK